MLAKGVCRGWAVIVVGAVVVGCAKSESPPAPTSAAPPPAAVEAAPRKQEESSGVSIATEHPFKIESFPDAEPPTPQPSTIATSPHRPKITAARVRDGDGNSQTARPIEPRNTKAQGAIAPSSGAFPEASPPDTAAFPLRSTTAEKQEAVVAVFYATDRTGTDRIQLGWLDYASQFRTTAVVALVVALIAMLVQWLRQAPQPRWLTGFGFSGIAVSAVLGILGCLRLTDDARCQGRVYGNGRGALELGKCEVSIPRHHRTGEFESPSVVRFEFREDPTAHIVLQSVHQLDETGFYRQLSQQVEGAANRDLFVFIHGYNVSFNDAARRAAQLAYDLPYTGTPLLFSWPSQGGLLQYTVDETNVEWSAPHLESFLDQLMTRFGADRLNLIAHSMGNRALVGALRGLAARGKIDGKLREIVLAAPDIDADIFRRDLAPLLVQLASRVTLYASANDEALLASRKVHGAPRAGDADQQLVLHPGIDTIDVSAVDTSFLGHTYYGSNVTVLEDLFHLLSRNLPPEQRKWLTPNERDGLRYWVLHRKALEQSAASRGELR